MSAVDPSRPDIAAFMALASAALKTTLPTPKDVFQFGRADNPAQNDRLLGLATAGLKTATTCWPIPDPLHWGVGDLSVILDGAGRPAAVMRTTSLVRCAFRDVAVDFALAEAEGSYEDYRRGHIEYYRKGKDGQLFSEDSVVQCERFEVIYSRNDEVAK
jgi:uncharacterized protein YhfF